MIDPEDTTGVNCFVWDDEPLREEFHPDVEAQIRAICDGWTQHGRQETTKLRRQSARLRKIPATP